LSVVKTDIWMPVFIGDYLADTMHLSTEQHGAYLLLLFHLWRRGSLRDEDAVLAQISGLGESAWKQHRGGAGGVLQDPGWPVAARAGGERTSSGRSNDTVEG
jgi:hypothetical protein